MENLYGNAVRWAMTLALALLPMLAANANNAPRFMENKGQFPDPVQYHLRVANADVFFEHDRLVFNFMDSELLGHGHHDHDGHGHHHEKGDGSEAHAYQVIFEGASPQVAVAGGHPYSDLTNYFQGNDPKKWASNVRAFEELRYSGIYPGIDLHYYGHEGTLKYDVILEVGADASAIAMRYEGVDGIFMKDGQLHVLNIFNEVIEMRPMAYQTIDGVRTEVSCEFSLTDETVGFIFPEGYDTTEELIIDPILIFSSYSGSTSNNFGFTATYDDDGALYGGGITYGTGYPTTIGVYSSGFGGQVDMALTKFSPDGSSLIWSTYIGGSSAESPNSMVVNGLGQLVVLGSTSSPNFPTSASAFDQTYNGGVSINYPSNGTDYTNGSDIVVLILSSDGSALVGSTFLGGSGNDGLNQSTVLAYNYGDNFRGEVIVDASDNIYITSSTLSSDLPVTSGVFDATLSGSQDVVVAKFGPNVSSLVWCGYLGGNSADAGYSLKLGSTGGIFVAGGTEGQSFNTTAGALNPNYLGGTADGFVARISNDGSTLERSTYIGTSSYDQTYFVEVDSDDEIYLYGQSLGPVTVTPGSYFNTNGRQFIQKLDSDLGTLLLTTRFGSGGGAVNISPTAFLVDVCNRIYVSGWGGGTNNFWNNATGSTTGMPITSNAFQSTTNGSDFYFMVLEADAASLLYATYFGGSNTQEHVDGGTSRFNRNGVIHQAVCAGCGGSSAFPTTPGAWSNTNNAAGGCNLGVIKLDMEITGVSVDITAGDNVSGCAPLQVTFNSALVNAADIVWDFGDGNTSDLPSPTHTFTSPGTYVIALVGTDTEACTGGVFSDTAYATVIVNDIADPADAGADQVVCGGASTQIGTPSIAGYSYSWSPGAGLSSANVAQPTASPGVPLTYILNVTDANGCQDTDQVQVGLFNVQAFGDTLICADAGSVPLSASAAASWSWTPVNLLNDPNSQNPIATVAETTVFNLEASDGQGCIVNQQVTVTVAPAPSANAGADLTVCSGASMTLSGSGGQQYAWNPSTFLSNPNIANPVATPGSAITYTLTVTDANGCSATDQVSVALNELPSVLAAPNVEVCEGDLVQLQASGALTYLWTPATGLDNPQSVSPQATVSETVTYTVTGTDVNGCVNTAEVTINVFDVNVTGQAGICPGFTAELGVDGGVEWAWAPANVLNDASIQNPIATINAPTVFTVAVSNGQGCVVVRQISVDVFPPAVASAGVDRVACDGAPVILSGSGGAVYAWSPATFLSNPNIQNPVSTPASDITYTLTVTDANGCVASDAVNVAVLPSPTAIVGPDVEICVGQSTQLTAEGGVTYSWAPLIAIDDPNSATPTVSPLQPTTYVVTVTDANGCTDVDSIAVSIFTMTAFASPDGTVCLGDSVLLTATNGVAFSWSPSNNVSDADAQSTFATPAENETYVVTATSQSGCEAIAEVGIQVIQNPVANFESDFVPTCDGVHGRFTNASSGADYYQWEFSVPPDSSSSTDAQLYFPLGQGPVVTLWAMLDGSGCVDSVTYDFSGQFFSNDSVEVFWPNVITPNDDGMNDCFKPGFIGEFSDCYELIVYNRWGALIFESIGTGNCWDGRTKAGTVMPEGTYYYIARVLNREKAGWVQLIKD
ncbi:MAG: gliding motility-associated C-terminal domain-containing protein [Flavobacteriales bacterium]|nr:gliding motility-associated C-terminal domain-containing protein [Flavobacteriales bacterium]